MKKKILIIFLSVFGLSGLFAENHTSITLSPSFNFYNDKSTESSLFYYNIGLNYEYINSSNAIFGFNCEVGLGDEFLKENDYEFVGLAISVAPIFGYRFLFNGKSMFSLTIMPIDFTWNDGFYCYNSSTLYWLSNIILSTQIRATFSFGKKLLNGFFIGMNVPYFRFSKFTYENRYNEYSVDKNNGGLLGIGVSVGYKLTFTDRLFK